jgi:pyruvate dehydrogenase E2 component (dihydrolipoamide acetyltransferase)
MRGVEVRVPDIGDFQDVEVVEVLVAPGDRVRVEDPLVAIESDKATMEIPSPHAGRVEQVAVSIGDKVSEGSLLLTLIVDAASELAEPLPEEPAPPPETAPSAPEATAPDRRRPPAWRPPVESVPAAPRKLPHASPLVRRMAREMGFDLSRARGSGRSGRILQQDLVANVRGALAGVTHPTLHDQADVTELEAFRERCADQARERGVELTLLPFLLKAAARALPGFPEFGAALSPDSARSAPGQVFGIGVSVETEDGILFPVMRGVERKGILEMAGEIAELAERARRRELSPAEQQEACFSITSLGGIGGTLFTPPVNPPELATLGVSSASIQPVWKEGDGDAEGRFVPRLILPLSLSYDHRVMAAASAARFTRHLAETLSQIENLLI